MMAAVVVVVIVIKKKRDIKKKAGFSWFSSFSCRRFVFSSALVGSTPLHFLFSPRSNSAHGLLYMIIWGSVMLLEMDLWGRMDPPLMYTSSFTVT